MTRGGGGVLMEFEGCMRGCVYAYVHVYVHVRGLGGFRSVFDVRGLSVD